MVILFVRIKVLFNVNQTVETDHMPDSDPEHPPKGDEEPAQSLRSRPDFDIEISKGAQKLCFSCYYASNDMEEQSPEGDGELS